MLISDAHLPGFVTTERDRALKAEIEAELKRLKEEITACEWRSVVFNLHPLDPVSRAQMRSRLTCVSVC